MGQRYYGSGKWDGEGGAAALRAPRRCMRLVATHEHQSRGHREHRTARRTTRACSRRAPSSAQPNRCVCVPPEFKESGGRRGARGAGERERSGTLHEKLARGPELSGLVRSMPTHSVHFILSCSFLQIPALLASTRKFNALTLALIVNDTYWLTRTL